MVRYKFTTGAWAKSRHITLLCCAHPYLLRQEPLVASDKRCTDLAAPITFPYPVLFMSRHLRSMVYRSKLGNNSKSSPTNRPVHLKRASRLFAPRRGGDNDYVVAAQALLVNRSLRFKHGASINVQLNQANPSEPIDVTMISSNGSTNEKYLMTRFCIGHAVR